MSNNYRVYQATIEDLNELAELFNKYRVFYGQAPDLEGARNFLFDRFEHQESIILCAKADPAEQLLGFIQLYPLFSSISMRRLLLLNDLYVDEFCRKQGIGQLLLDAAKDYAEKVRAKGLQLSTALTNSTAQSLYEKNGYVRDNEFYHYFLGLQPV
ncbi:GNAT family N-acetyltransferase [Paenibacillus sp. YPG26]|uniref:GNAT family N-acetyltransferase n=1 Tax=Paenibacillus sp. YPG26 TaxID=2878915 RepID=UPI00203C88F4|nr:GNAT family N-acetyltransferase [Paenibacillus sp. YPG26]USB34042.1 GNAT family N-acetyltransferase [Paenibacillus sp. YPG26]